MLLARPTHFSGSPVGLGWVLETSPGFGVQDLPPIWVTERVLLLLELSFLPWHRVTVPRAGLFGGLVVSPRDR